MHPGSWLLPGGSLVSPNRMYELKMGHDGVLRLTGPDGVETWNSVRNDGGTFPVLGFHLGTDGVASVKAR